MAEFNGRYRMGERERLWNDNVARQRQDAHQEWQQNEERRRYDEEARLTLAESQRQSQFMSGNAGLFNDTAMTDMSPRTDAPLQVTGVTGTTPPAGNASAGVVPPNTPAAPTTPTTPVTPTPEVPAAQSGRQQLRPNRRLIPEGETTDIQVGNGTIRAHEREQLYREYVNAVSEYNAGRMSLGRMQEARSRAVSARMISVNDRNLQPHSPTVPVEGMTWAERNAYEQYARAVERYNTGTSNERALTNFRSRAIQAGVIEDVPEPGGAEAQTAGAPGLNPEAPGIESVARRAVGNRVPRQTAGLNTDLPATSDIDSVFDGINDTSRPLQPTREMRLADAAMRNDLERAQLYAAHGRPELAAEAFGRALQQRAGYITQERTVMYRAAANGSMRAMERLIEEYNGYGRGEVRVQHAGGSNFALFIQNEGGEWVQASRPLSRDAMLSSLQNLVDAEGAAARSEANREYMTNVMNNQTELAVAGIVADTAQDRMFTDVQIARMSNDLRRQLAAGNVTQVQNEETGTTELYYPRFVDGEVQIMMEEVSTETQRTADTNGRREAEVRVRREVPVATRATGVVNVRAN